MFQEYLFLVTVPPSEATLQGPSSNSSPVAEEAPGPPREMNELQSRNRSQIRKRFALTVGPIDKVGSLWRVPGLEEPKK